MSLGHQGNCAEFGSSAAARRAAEKEAEAAAEAAAVNLGDIKHRVHEKLERHRARHMRKAVQREE